MSKQYRKASHCVYDLKYHIVWITKYRKPVLGKEVGTRVRELIRMICASLRRGDREREYQTGPCASSGERAADAGSVQARAAHEGADITEAFDGKPRIKQDILGEASVGPRVLCGQHRERERRNDRALYRESRGPGAGRGCRLQSRTVMSAPSALADERKSPDFSRGWVKGRLPNLTFLMRSSCRNCLSPELPAIPFPAARLIRNATDHHTFKSIKIPPPTELLKVNFSNSSTEHFGSSSSSLSVLCDPKNEVPTSQKLELACYRFHCTESMFCVTRHFKCRRRFEARPAQQTFPSKCVKVPAILEELFAGAYEYHGPRSILFETVFQKLA